MKNMKTIIGAAAVLALGAVSAFALESADGRKLSGPHWQFNIIGHPKGVDAIGGDDSNGRAIMVPLRNATGPNAIVCEDSEIIMTDDEVATFQDQAPTGAKIYFEASDHFEIVDRDATDSNGATILVPTTTEVDPLNPEGTQDVIAFDIYIRVLGKPNTCMDISAWAFDEGQQLYFWAGSVDVNRKTGRSTYVRVNELFDVHWCQVIDSDGNGILDENDTCAAGTEVELSVFNNVFSSYFWNILNNGTRNVQVRLYPKTL